MSSAITIWYTRMIWIIFKENIKFFIEQPFQTLTRGYLLHPRVVKGHAQLISFQAPNNMWKNKNIENQLKAVCIFVGVKSISTSKFCLHEVHMIEREEKKPYFVDNTLPKVSPFITNLVEFAIIFFVTVLLKIQGARKFVLVWAFLAFPLHLKDSVRSCTSVEILSRGVMLVSWLL